MQAIYLAKLSYLYSIIQYLVRTTKYQNLNADVGYAIASRVLLMLQAYEGGVKGVEVFPIVITDT